MKRWTMRTAAIAVAILVALTGVALAVTNSMGVLRFLFSKQAQTPTGLPVQIEVPQAGGDAMETITVQVRDAVSDGLMIHMAVAFSAKNPDDAVLFDTDSGYLSSNRGAAWTFPAEEEGKGFGRPFVSKLHQAKRVLLVGTPTAMLGSANLVIDAGWFYESPRVLVMDYVIDLRPSAFERDYRSGHLPQLPLPDPLTIELMPSVWQLVPGEVESRCLERGRVEVTVAHDTDQSTHKTYVATNLPIEGPCYRIDEARFVSTPIGIYCTLDLTSPKTPGWDPNKWPRLELVWFDGVNASGQKMEMLPPYGYGTSQDADHSPSTAQRLELIFAAQELTETFTLRPWTHQAGKRTMFPDIQLTLREE